MAVTRPAIGAKPVPKRATTEIIRTNLLEHPAVKAWAKLLPGRIEPESIEIIREHQKSAVYRLAGVGPRCSTVIAKRCQTALIERTIYEEVLPHLSIPALHYYGFTGEDDKFDWLFLEDAGREEFSPLIEEHRALAARWLGLMHTAAACVATADHLPDRGPGHYLEHLRSGCDKILRSLANPTLKADDLVVLENIVSQCEVLESCWRQVEGFCAGLPRTLVHGDFKGKNLRLRAGRAGIALLPFDWEMAGWGVPAADLVQSARLGRARFAANPDVATYWSVVREHWPSLDLQTIQQLANCGKMFRSLAAIDWRAQDLACEVKWAMSDMRIYQVELIDAIQTAGWRA
jgi:hypothetical protein